MARPTNLISADSIPYVKEDRLKREVATLETRKHMILRDRSRGNSQHTTLLVIETDICYLQREIEIRENRRKAHALFLQKRQNKRAKRR